MELIERKGCVFTNSKNMEHLSTIGRFPVFLGCADDLYEKDIMVDMSWSICVDSGILQLDKFVPPSVLYSRSHGAGLVGNTWKEHRKQLAKFIGKINPASVFEIGGGEGLLATEYSKIKNIPWAILEPNSKHNDLKNITFIRGFFDDSSFCDSDADVVVASHVFEHAHHPDNFMKHLSVLVEEGKYLILALPNMEEELRQKYTNCIMLEHTFFLTQHNIEYILSKHGFRIVETENFLDNNSVFYAAIKDSGVDTIKLINQYSENKKLYLDYIRHYESLIARLNSRLEHVDGQEVYLFGAHIFSQHLISVGLHTDSIVSVLDNDVNKQGRRLYGSTLRVDSPERLRGKKNPIVILFAAGYNEEIKQGILNNINNSVVFWED